MFPGEPREVDEQRVIDGLSGPGSFTACPTSEGMLIGYVRVSTDDQNLALQLAPLKKAGLQAHLYGQTERNTRRRSPRTS
jgi:hypothetical protein